MVGFLQVLKHIKWEDLSEEGKKNGCTALRTGAKIHYSAKNILGFEALKQCFINSKGTLTGNQRSYNAFKIQLGH